MAFKSSSRNGARVIWIAVHTAEGATSAANLKAYFDRASTQASSHAIADDNVLWEALVPYDRASWTLRNGNSRSDNLEITGFARWSRAEWLNHMGMLRNTAQWIRNRCLARGIPMVKLSPADVRAGKAGVIGHVDYTNGTGDGTHWDPGPNFPWDLVMQMANNNVQEDDMQLSDNVTLFDGSKVPLNNVLAGIFARLAGLQSREFPHVKADIGDFVTAVDQNVIRTQRQAERIDDIEVKVDAALQSLNTVVAKLNQLLEGK